MKRRSTIAIISLFLAALALGHCKPRGYVSELRSDGEDEDLAGLDVELHADIAKINMFLKDMATVGAYKADSPKIREIIELMRTTSSPLARKHAIKALVTVSRVYDLPIFYIEQDHKKDPDDALAHILEPRNDEEIYFSNIIEYFGYTDEERRTYPELACIHADDDIAIRVFDPETFGRKDKPKPATFKVCRDYKTCAESLMLLNPVLMLDPGHHKVKKVIEDIADDLACLPPTTSRDFLDFAIMTTALKREFFELTTYGQMAPGVPPSVRRGRDISQDPQLEFHEQQHAKQIDDLVKKYEMVLHDGDPERELVPAGEYIHHWNPMQVKPYYIDRLRKDAQWDFQPEERRPKNSATGMTFADAGYVVDRSQDAAHFFNDAAAHQLLLGRVRSTLHLFGQEPSDPTQWLQTAIDDPVSNWRSAVKHGGVKPERNHLHPMIAFQALDIYSMYEMRLPYRGRWWQSMNSVYQNLPPGLKSAELEATLAKAEHLSIANKEQIELDLLIKVGKYSLVDAEKELAKFDPQFHSHYHFVNQYLKEFTKYDRAVKKYERLVKKDPKIINDENHSALINQQYASDAFSETLALTACYDYHINEDASAFLTLPEFKSEAKGPGCWAGPTANWSFGLGYKPAGDPKRCVMKSGDVSLEKFCSRNSTRISRSLLRGQVNQCLKQTRMAIPCEEITKRIAMIPLEAAIFAAGFGASAAVSAASRATLSAILRASGRQLTQTAITSTKGLGAWLGTQTALLPSRIYHGMTMSASFIVARKAILAAAGLETFYDQEKSFWQNFGEEIAFGALFMTVLQPMMGAYGTVARNAGSYFPTKVKVNFTKQISREFYVARYVEKSSMLSLNFATILGLGVGIAAGASALSGMSPEELGIDQNFQDQLGQALLFTAMIGITQGRALKAIHKESRRLYKRRKLGILKNVEEASLRHPEVSELSTTNNPKKYRKYIEPVEEDVEGYDWNPVLKAQGKGTGSAPKAKAGSSKIEITDLDPLEVLGVPRRAGSWRIWRAYRAKRKQIRGMKEPADQQRAKAEIEEAYRQLKDPKRRQEIYQASEAAEALEREPFVDYYKATGQRRGKKFNQKSFDERLAKLEEQLAQAKQSGEPTKTIEELELNVKNAKDGAKILSNKSKAKEYRQRYDDNKSGQSDETAETSSALKVDDWLMNADNWGDL